MKKGIRHCAYLGIAFSTTDVRRYCRTAPMYPRKDEDTAHLWGWKRLSFLVLLEHV